MKTNSLCLIFIMVLIVTGCIPSIYPLYFEDDLLFDERLLGAWSEDGSANSWAFEQDGGRQYILRHLEVENLRGRAERPGKLGIFEVHLLILDTTLFLDFYPGENEQLEINDMMAFHLYPVHTFATIHISDDTLKIFQFDPSYLEDQIKERKVRIKYEQNPESGILLSASTKELQDFFSKYASDPDAVIDPIILLKRHD